MRSLHVVLLSHSCLRPMHMCYSLHHWPACVAVLCRCVSGCSCEESVINGYHADHSSLLKLHRVYVSQHEECVMEVQVRGQ
jgi:hypothetical protein